MLSRKIVAERDGPNGTRAQPARFWPERLVLAAATAQTLDTPVASQHPYAEHPHPAPQQEFWHLEQHLLKRPAINSASFPAASLSLRWGRFDRHITNTPSTRQHLLPPLRPGGAGGALGSCLRSTPALGVSFCPPAPLRFSLLDGPPRPTNRGRRFHHGAATLQRQESSSE